MENNILAIETFDTSVLENAIFGEDNELIFLSDDDEVRQADLYSDADYDFEMDFPEDYGQDSEEPTEANFNLGWGTIEGEIFNSQWD
jgi:hypothetical protein